MKFYIILAALVVASMVTGYQAENIGSRIFVIMNSMKDPETRLRDCVRYQPRAVEACMKN